MLTIAAIGFFFPPTLFGLLLFFLHLGPRLPVPTTCCVAGKLRSKQR